MGFSVRYLERKQNPLFFFFFFQVSGGMKCRSPAGRNRWEPPQRDAAPTLGTGGVPAGPSGASGVSGSAGCSGSAAGAPAGVSLKGRFIFQLRRRNLSVI